MRFSQVYEEVILSGDAAATGGGIIDQFVDVAEVEVGDGRSASPVKVEAATAATPRRRGPGKRGLAAAAAAAAASGDSAGGGNHIVSVGGGAAGPEFHICRLCSQIIPPDEIPTHNQKHHGALGELTCTDCGKVFKSKRSLFGHRKEKHSGVTEVHHCPECGKSFGRKSNLKAHRESLHYGKKFPCSYCERIFTNRSSMNQVGRHLYILLIRYPLLNVSITNVFLSTKYQQHIKKTHTVPEAASFVLQPQQQE